jgi:hypothetical protein
MTSAVESDSAPVPVPCFYGEPNGIPVFKPTVQEFSDFEKYVKSIESYGKQVGIVKIIPPEDWKNEMRMKNDLSESLRSVTIKKPITQEATGGGLPSGACRIMNFEDRKSYSGWLTMNSSHISLTFVYS